MSQSAQFLGTGRRKTAVARVRLAPGTGTIVVNERTFEVYFPVEEAWEADFSANDDLIRLANPIASQMAVMRSSLFGGLISNLVTVLCGCATSCTRVSQRRRSAGRVSSCSFMHTSSSRPCSCSMRGTL